MPPFPLRLARSDRRSPTPASPSLWRDSSAETDSCWAPRSGRYCLLGDRPADHNPGAPRQLRQRRIQNRTAHVVKIDVNALRALFPKRPAHVFGLVVDGRIEAQLMHDIATLP